MSASPTELGDSDLLSQFSMSRDFAQDCDAADILAPYRKQFELPMHASGQPLIYLCGHSLGLAPRAALDYVSEELADWAQLGVGGPSHRDAAVDRLRAEFHQGAAARHRCAGERSRRDEFAHHEPAPDDGVVLSARRHARQGADRGRRVFIGSSRHSRRSSSWHKLDAEETLIEIAPRAGEETLRIEDIEAKIEELGSELALVLWPGVQYRTGQAFDCARITRAAHAQGAIAGFDLAHAIGNLPLQLHDWDVDFAVWCSYKYLNAGPGAIGGAFVHERHFANAPSRLSGWWGHEPQTRFQMMPEFRPAAGAAGWAVSNPPIFSAAPLLASLEMFRAAGIGELRAKSVRLTAYAERLLPSAAAATCRSSRPRRRENAAASCRCASGGGQRRGRRIFDALARSRHRLRLARARHHPHRARAAATTASSTSSISSRSSPRRSRKLLEPDIGARASTSLAPGSRVVAGHPAREARLQGHGVRTPAGSAAAAPTAAARSTSRSPRAASAACSSPACSIA